MRRADSQIIGKDGMAFHKLPEMVTRYLSHPDPVIIPYTIKWVQPLSPS